MESPPRQMRRLTLLWWFSGGLFLLAALYAVFVYGEIADRLESEFQSASSTILERFASDLGSPLWLHQRTFVDELLSAAWRRGEVAYIQVRDSDGETISERLSSAGHYGPGRESQGVPDVLLLKRQIRFNDEIVGEITAGFDRLAVRREIGALQWKLLGALGLLALVLVILTRYTTSRLLRPLQEIAGRFERFEQQLGKESLPRLSVGAGRELEPLLDSINRFTLKVSAELDQSVRQQQFMESLFTLSPVALLFCDINGRIVRCNRSAAEIFGCDIDTLSEETLERLIGASDYYNIKNHLFKSGGSLNGYVSYYGGAGDGRRALEVNASLVDSQDNLDQMIVTIADITDKLDTQHEIMKSQVRLSEINLALEERTRQLKTANSRNESYAHKLGDLIKLYYKIARCSRNDEILDLLVRGGARLLVARRAVVYLYENRQRRLLPVISHPGPPLRRNLEEHSRHVVAQTYADQQPFFIRQAEADNLKEMGLVLDKPVCMMTVPLGDHDHKYGVAVYFGNPDQPFSAEDIHLATTMCHQAALMLKKMSLMNVFRERATQLQRSNEHLQQSQHQLFQFQKMESLGTLVGGIAHDYNNLLGIINPNLDLLRISAGDERETMKRLEIIERATHRATELTRQLLMFSSTGEIHLKPLALNQVVRRVADMLRHAMSEETGINIELELDPELPNVMGDEAHLMQALTNLAFNARDAMREGGTLTFRSSVEPFAPAGERSPRNFDRLSITDTGKGIPREHLYNIFDPFFTTKGSGDGSGLGLSITYGIIKSHHGYISVETKERRGSSFHIFLPPTHEAVEPAADFELDGFPVGSEGILVVDDEMMIRESLRDLLSFLGYEVFLAGSGPEALETLGGGDEIRAAIVDYAMPQMDGLETIREIRKQHPEIKIVLSTGYGDKERMVRNSVKVEGVLPKPYHLGNLADVMRRILSQGAEA